MYTSEILASGDHSAYGVSAAIEPNGHCSIELTVSAFEAVHGNYGARLDVDLETSADGATWTPLARFTTVLARPDGIQNASQRLVVLPDRYVRATWNALPLLSAQPPVDAGLTWSLSADIFAPEPEA